tara:strand:+ start:143 stop:385 length:243 start_codon:yes stop_codon:yes gene_type:complete
MKKEQELLNMSYKESVRQKRERKKKEKLKKEKRWEDFMPFYLQWYWTRDWLNKKTKAWYNGPRIKWMNLFKEKKRKKKEK